MVSDAIKAAVLASDLSFSKRAALFGLTIGQVAGIVKRAGDKPKQRQTAKRCRKAKHWDEALLTERWADRKVNGGS